MKRFLILLIINLFIVNYGILFSKPEVTKVDTIFSTNDSLFINLSVDLSNYTNLNKIYLNKYNRAINDVIISNNNTVSKIIPELNNIKKTLGTRYYSKFEYITQSTDLSPPVIKKLFIINKIRNNLLILLTLFLLNYFYIKERYRLNFEHFKLSNFLFKHIAKCLLLSYFVINIILYLVLGFEKFNSLIFINSLQ